MVEKQQEANAKHVEQINEEKKMEENVKFDEEKKKIGAKDH